MDLDAAGEFAQQWVDEWNAHDLERILAHYTDDVVFVSPLVVELTGEPSGEVRGKAALGDYWAKALARSPDLHFTVEDVRVCLDTVVINFRNQRGQAAAEVLTFRGGKVRHGVGAKGREVDGRS